MHRFSEKASTGPGFHHGKLGNCERILEIAGIRLRDKNALEQINWIEQRARELNLESTDAYERLLEEDSPEGWREREHLTVHFSTGETYFFRDQGLFSLLAEEILPELIERRETQRSLRIWSAGCATGEEAYSLAMLLDEMAPRLAGWDVLILGTDINTHAIERGRKGIYGQWSFRSLDQARKDRYFRPCSGDWMIDARLRKMVKFDCLDLVHDDFPDSTAWINDIDLIICRNVFIYLSSSAVAQIARKFATTLSDGGYLIAGHSEIIGCPSPSLRTRIFPQSVVLQKTEKVPAAACTQLRQSFQIASIGISIQGVATQAKLPIEKPGASFLARPQPRQSTLPSAERPQAVDFEAELQTAWNEADCGAVDAAVAACRRAIAGVPFDPRPYYLLAQIAQESGATEEARLMLKKVLYIDPSFIAAYLDLADLYARAGEADSARRMHQNARGQLKKMPSHTPLAIYQETTAGELLHFVERLLASPATTAPDPNQTAPSISAYRSMRG